MIKKIKVGVVGTGFIGPAHIEAIRRLGFVEVLGLAGSDLERTKQKAAELGIPRAYSDYREMLNEDDIQVIHNCTYNNLHFQINKDSILAGKHIVSEKPLAMNSIESAYLVSLAKQHGIVHAVNFNYRQFPSVQNLQAKVANGDFGKINLVHGGYLQDWLLYETDYNWRMNPEYGGESRAIADIGSHWCDTVQYVTGKKITEVFADFSTVHPIRRKSTSAVSSFEGKKKEENVYEDIEIDTEDFASVLLRFEDGTRGNFIVSQVSAGRKNNLHFELDGSTSSAAWNQEEPEKLWIGHRDRPNEILLADANLFAKEAKGAIHHPGGHNEGWPDALKNMMKNFYQFVRENKSFKDNKPKFATFEDGHNAMCIIDAIVKSHKTEQWVKVNYKEEVHS